MGVEAERQLLQEAQRQGTGATLRTYARLSGPGWLQSAITLGGGTLANSLFLGVFAGLTVLWLQPVAMILGIIMLSAIGYVTMSTGERPFKAINEHVNPVLGWSWAIASLMASMVWCLPQYSLANNVLQQNLMPNLVGPGSELGDFQGKLLISGIILVLTTAITWSYGRAGRGIRLYETVLKTMVAAIVLCFIGVVVRMSFAEEGLDWEQILQGFVPDFASLYRPAPGYTELLAALPTEYRQFWENRIVSQQREVMIGAAATAVGINMTFLFPYTLLRRGWTREFRGLATFDLATGMLIPFTLATSCVIIASAQQFHPGMDPSTVANRQIEQLLKNIEHYEREQGSSTLIASTTTEEASKKEKIEKLLKMFTAIQEHRLQYQLGMNEFAKLSETEVADQLEPLTPVEKRLGLALIKPDALDLARSLEPLTGGFFANVIFGLGVLGMTLSTITLLMLISGLVICEMLGLPTTGWSYRLGTLAATVGVLGPFVWGDVAFYLAVPTSVFGMTLLPIAYLTFFLLMNQKSLLGDDLPRGGRRVLWNLLMAIAAGIATFLSAWVIWNITGLYGAIGAGTLLALALVVQIARSGRPHQNSNGVSEGSV